MIGSGQGMLEVPRSKGGFTMVATARKFDIDEQKTWMEILQQHKKKRDNQICDIFLKGLSILKIDESHIPSLDEVNKILVQKSGFRGVFVEGLEEGASFYKMLAQREFPVGNFIRSRQDINYTPAPDVVHDLYGHLPFYTDRAYGDFCQKFGELAIKYVDQPVLFRQFERFFWFTAEFGLVNTPKGIRIFGAGIASSIGECEYALSGKPEVKPFDVALISQQEFRIDQMQTTLFCLESPEQLYNSLNELSEHIEKSS